MSYKIHINIWYPEFLDYEVHLKRHSFRHRIWLRTETCVAELIILHSKTDLSTKETIYRKTTHKATKHFGDNCLFPYKSYMIVKKGNKSYMVVQNPKN